MGDTKLDTAPFEFTTSSFLSHEFTDTIFGLEVTFSVLKMEGCTFIWIGAHTNKTFSDLSMSMMTLYEKEPVSTKLMGPMTDLNSQALSKKLSKRLAKQVYVSFNIPSDRNMVDIEKRLCQEIVDNPEAF